MGGTGQAEGPPVSQPELSMDSGSVRDFLSNTHSGSDMVRHLKSAPSKTCACMQELVSPHTYMHMRINKYAYLLHKEYLDTDY